jgi:type I restriction enzyme M protein
MSNPTALVSKLWNYCSILRVDGLSYGDYVEQLTFLLFLKMADEQSRLRGTPSAIPKGKDWPSLLAKDGDELEVHYRHTLEELGKCSGMLGIMLAPASPTGLRPVHSHCLSSLRSGSARRRTRSRTRPSCGG